VKNDLLILPEHISGQIGIAICRETRLITQQRVPYLFLSLCAVNTAVVHLIVVVIIRVNLTGRDYRDVSTSRPRHHPADMRQNPSMVPYAGLAPS